MLCVFNKEMEDLYQNTISYTSLDVYEGKGIWNKIVNLFHRINRLKLLKRQVNPDVSISHLEGADLINVLTGIKDRSIVVFHGSKKADIKYKGAYHFFRHAILIPLVIKKADHIICVSEGIRSEIISQYNSSPEKISVVYNFFDINGIEKFSNEILSDTILDSLFDSKDILINCARLDIQKNINALLDIFVIVKKHSKDVKLLLLGDGDERDSLIYYSKECKLKTYDCWSQPVVTNDFDVYFLGNIANPFCYIKRAKIFTLTSGWEGFPLALGEAMICGTPVISTDCLTGPREMLAPGTELVGNLLESEFADYGVLMPLLDKKNKSYDESVRLWSRTILELLQDEKRLKHYSDKGIERMKNFSREKIVDRWLKIIAFVLGESKQ